MWLPRSVYRFTPYYWMLLGVLLVVLGTYRLTKVDLVIGMVCLVSGVASCFWSLQVGLSRRTRPESDADDVALDQTCELSYKPD